MYLNNTFNMGLTLSNYHYDLSTDELQHITNDLETKKYKISNSEYYITHANGPSTLVINSKGNKEIKVYERLNFDTNSNIGKTIINQFENISKIEKYDKFVLNKRKKLKITEYYLFYDYCQYQGSEKEPIVCSTKPLFKINYDNLWIGKDIIITNSYLDKYFGFGNTLLIQKGDKLYSLDGVSTDFVKDNATYTLTKKQGITENVLGYFSPIDNNDVPIPIIVTNRKIVVLFGNIYQFTIKDINFTEKELQKILKTNIIGPESIPATKTKLFNKFYDNIIEKIIN